MHFLSRPKKNEIEVPGLPKAILLTDKNIRRRGWQPLKKIEWRISSEAKHMQCDDPVLELYLNGKAWAVPCWILKHYPLNLI